VKHVDSDALSQVNKALGLMGADPSSETVFNDKTLVQSFDTVASARRGRTFAQSTGIFTGALRTVHAGAGTLQCTTNPFDVAVGALGAYPVPIPMGFDVWLIAAFANQISGTGTFTGALRIRPAAASQGFGVDDSAVAVVSQGRYVVAFWDTIVDQTNEFGQKEDGNPMQKIGLRLPRGTVLRFSSTASALATFECNVIVGVFPVGLGQDILA